MKRVVYILIAVLALASCAPKNSAKVVFNIPDAADSTEVIVTKLAINRIYAVDTLYVKGQKLSFETTCTPGAPDFYYFYAGDNKFSSLVLQSGDRLAVEATLKDGVSSVEGSEEASRYAEVEKTNTQVLKEVQALADALVNAQTANDQKGAQEATRELSKLFIKHKQNATRYLYDNPKSITVIPVMYQRLSPELPLFGDVNDVFIFKTVYEALSVAYPQSPYVTSLADDIRQRERYIGFGNKVNDIQELSYPDISLYDQNAKVRNLSELDGNVIILSFWSTLEPTHKVFNAELKQIYDKYKNKGLAIYQVCADMDKTAWATQIKDQGIEWVSVCDPGNVSRTLDLYNIKKIPALFIIDRKGDIVEKDLFDPAKLEKAVARLVR